MKRTFLSSILHGVLKGLLISEIAIPYYFSKIYFMDWNNAETPSFSKLKPSTQTDDFPPSAGTAPGGFETACQ